MGKVDEKENGIGESGLDKVIASYPKIEVRYEQNTESILGKASIEEGEIVKIELIYKGKVLEKETRTVDLDKEQKFEVKEYGTGWYKVRATSDKGKTKIATVKATKISGVLKKPEVTFEPDKPDGENEWYKTEGKVVIKVETDSPSAKEIHYTLSGANAEGEKIINGTKGSFEISNSGITSMVIWTENGNGHQSKEVIKNLRN